MDAYTYVITDTNGQTFYATTEYMDVENLWYRGNTNLNLSHDSTQYNQRDVLISNSSMISNYRSGNQGGTYYTTIASIKRIDTTDSVDNTFALIGIGVIILLLIFAFTRKGKKKKWRDF